MPDKKLPPFILEHRVRTFETGTGGTLTPSALLNLMQHAAGKHADELGWSVRSLHDAGRTWVLQRFYMEIRQPPADNALFRIKTRPSGADRLLAYRDYIVENPDGDILAKATSSWVVMDLNSRRPVGITDDVKELGNRFGPRDLEAPGGRLRPFDPPENAPSFRVRKHDLDLNNHVNNVRFIEWGLESVPDETWNSGQLYSLDITFKAECFFGDEVISAVQKIAENIFDHCLIRRSDQKPVCLIRSRWK